MISKERLEELIEQGATIYELDINFNIFHLDLRDYRDVKIEEVEEYSLKRLHETEEDAQWHKEFGCIERTERLELPTWEDFNRVEFYTTSGRVIFKKIIESYPISINSDELKDYEFIEIAEIMFDNGSCYYYHEPATKENYTIACRKCKELFLGENNDKENS